MRLGHTLLELLVVLHIVAVLAAITYPVFAAARREAKITRSISQMKTIGTALALYREEQADEGPLGFGLPPSLYDLKRARRLPQALSDTGGTNVFGLTKAVYLWLPPALPASDSSLSLWRDYLQSAGDNPFLLLDTTHNPSSTSIFDFYDTRLVLAMRLDTSVSRRQMMGEISSYSIWKNQR
ncbi:MAG: hypothetical protein C4320_01655 [Armatimonadota bacterium]